MNYTFSDRISSLKPSAIREILKRSSQPGIIPFSAGNPAPEAFPVDEIREISADILTNRPIDALQYSVTEGYQPLIEELSRRLKAENNIGKEFDKLIITSGAQQVMDLAAKALCNEGDAILCETPSFIGSLNCFRSYNCKLIGAEVEPDGINLEHAESILKNNNIKFIYTIPNFQNPSGATMSMLKRKNLYELALKYGALIVEDNPYGDLRVSGEDIPSIKSMDSQGIVIYAGSFSKILSPGMRVGYSLAPAEITAKMVVGKQGSDVHTTIFTQLIVNEWLRKYDVKAHINKIKDIYGRKLNLMCDQIDSQLSDIFAYSRPEGGLFVWCELLKEIDMLDYCEKALDKKVAVVPGTAFLADTNAGSNHIRLNFSTPTDEDIIKGVSLLKSIKI